MFAYRCGWSEGSPGLNRPVSHSPLNFFCSREQSNDELVMEILSDMLKRLPVSVEKKEYAGTPSTLKCIMSSPIWESLYKSIQGKHRRELHPRGRTRPPREWESGFPPKGATEVKSLREHHPPVLSLQAEKKTMLWLYFCWGWVRKVRRVVAPRLKGRKSSLSQSSQEQLCRQWGSDPDNSGQAKGWGCGNWPIKFSIFIL